MDHFAVVFGKLIQNQNLFCKNVRSFFRNYRCLPLNPVSPCSFSFTRRYLSQEKSARKYTKPLSFDWAGDVEKTLPTIDKTKVKPIFEEVDNIKDADDSIKKIFSLEYSDKQTVRNAVIEDFLEKVKAHPADVQSLEVKIAKQTFAIREQIDHCLNYRKDKISKHKLLGRIRLRRSYMNKLNILDKERLDWLLKELNLQYLPDHEYYPLKLTRRERRIKAIEDRAAELQETKMVQFRKKLEEEKAKFLEFKNKEMAIIEKDLIELGISPKGTMKDILRQLGEDVSGLTEEDKLRQSNIDKVPNVFRKYAVAIPPKKFVLLMQKKMAADKALYEKMGIPWEYYQAKWGISTDW